MTKPSPILPNVISAIEPGSVVALVGCAGSGKTVAMRHLVARFLCDGEPGHRVFEPSIFVPPDHLVQIYERHLLGKVGLWSPGKKAPSARALVIPTGQFDGAELEGALALIQSEISAGDLVVIDEICGWDRVPNLDRLLIDLLDEGARLLLVAQRGWQIPTLPDRELPVMTRMVRFKGTETEMQRELATPGELILGGKRYRYSPSAEDLRWHAGGEKPAT